jgi:predicted ester cyclase
MLGSIDIRKGESAYPRPEAILIVPIQYQYQRRFQIMKKLSWLFITLSTLLLLALVAGPPLVAQDDNDPAANKAVLAAFFEAEAARDYGRFDELFVSDFVRHSVATTAVMPGVEVTSLEAYKQFLQATAAMFPDYYNTPQALIADGEYVAFYSIFSGTFVENGNHIEIPIVGYARFAHGKIAELWVEWDNITWNAQMGIASVSDTTTIEQQNAETARQLFTGWVNRTPGLVGEFVRDYALWCPANEACIPMQNSFRQTWVEGLLAAFPDLHVTIKRVVANGDTVFVDLTGRGTFSHVLLDPMSGEMLAATNHQESWSLLWIGTFEDGKVSREQWYWYWHNWPVTPPS